MNEPTALLTSLLIWICGQKEFENKCPPRIFVPPPVEEVSKERLMNVRTRGKILSSLAYTYIKNNTEAAYEPEEKTIYIRKHSRGFGKIETEGILVHELVHYVQYELGLDKRVACVARLEKDAYALQARYLREHGKEPNVDAFTGLARSLCYR